MDKGLDGSLASHCYICLAWMATGTRVESRPSSLPLHVLVPHFLERILEFEGASSVLSPSPSLLPWECVGRRKKNEPRGTKESTLLFIFIFILDMDIPMCDVCDVCAFIIVLSLHHACGWLCWVGGLVLHQLRFISDHHLLTRGAMTRTHGKFCDCLVANGTSPPPSTTFPWYQS